MRIMPRREKGRENEEEKERATHIHLQPYMGWLPNKGLCNQQYWYTLHVLVTQQFLSLVRASYCMCKRYMYAYEMNVGIVLFFSLFRCLSASTIFQCTWEYFLCTCILFAIPKQIQLNGIILDRRLYEPPESLLLRLLLLKAFAAKSSQSIRWTEEKVQNCREEKYGIEEVK